MEKFDAFISYSSKDSFPLEVCKFLENEGIKCWIAPRNIFPGPPYARAIMRGIEASDIILVFISKNSLQSEDVLNEIDNAHGLKKTIVPIFIEDAELTPEFNYYLKRKQWIAASSHRLTDILSLFSQNRKHIQKFICPKYERVFSIASSVQLRNIFNQSIDGIDLFSDIIIGFEPSTEFDRQLYFSSQVPSNNIPEIYISAVKRGLEKAIDIIKAKGFNLQGIKAILYDGSFHPVTSSEFCFEICARDAFIKALAKVGISVLNPIMRIELEGESNDENFINNFINRHGGEIFNFLKTNQGYEAHALIPNNEFTNHYKKLLLKDILIKSCALAKYKKVSSFRKK